MEVSFDLFQEKTKRNRVYIHTLERSRKFDAIMYADIRDSKTLYPVRRKIFMNNDKERNKIDKTTINDIYMYVYQYTYVGFKLFQLRKFGCKTYNDSLSYASSMHYSN